jgi:DHA1 family tetracycline resistance protein-like MFS transporter
MTIFLYIDMVPGIRIARPGAFFDVRKGGSIVQEQVNRMFFKRLRRNKTAFAMLMYEPMWGIPYNLFSPYLSLYMVALGCTSAQIGIISALGMVLQMAFSLLAAPITDRMGRKRATLVFDTASWSAAVVIWIFANDFWVFVAAAVVQAINRVVHVSWNCLMIEDTEKDLLVPLFSWFTIAGLLAALFSPIAVELVKAYTIVPAMRWMMGVAFVLMTLMFILRNAATHETSVGRVRMEQSKSEPFFRQLKAMFLVVADIRRSRKTMFFFILTAIYNAAISVKAPFFALLLTEALGFDDYVTGYFTAASSLVMLAVYLFVQPVLARFRPKAPLSVGLGLCAAGSAVLLPELGSYAANMAAVVVSVVLSALGTAIAQPFIDGISHGSIDNDKRANMTSILIASTLLASAPFTLFGGFLFDWYPRISFLVATALFVLSASLIVFLYKNEARPDAAKPAADPSHSG